MCLHPQEQRVVKIYRSVINGTDLMRQFKEGILGFTLMTGAVGKRL